MTVFIALLIVALILTIRDWVKHPEARTPYKSGKAFRTVIWLAVFVLLITMLAAEKLGVWR